MELITQEEAKMDDATVKPQEPQPQWAANIIFGVQE